MNDLVTSQPQAPEPRAQAPGDFLDMIDNLAYAARARLTAGAAPTAGALAWFDWSMHLALSPGKQRSLWLDAWRKQFPELPLTCIGKIKEGEGITIRDKQGVRLFTANGYTHFA